MKFKLEFYQLNGLLTCFYDTAPKYFCGSVDCKIGKKFSAEVGCFVRVHMSFGKFWNIMEIENAIFQDLKNFGKERIFRMAMEKFWMFA